jgi:hypothetical protein
MIKVTMYLNYEFQMMMMMMIKYYSISFLLCTLLLCIFYYLQYNRILTRCNYQACFVQNRYDEQTKIEFL